MNPTLSLWLRLLAGPAAATILYLLFPETVGSGATALSVSHEARLTLAAAVWMGSWWLLEPVHVSITALLPLVLFPIFGIASMKAASAPYAQEMVFLFLGGFIIAEAMQQTGLHHRVANFILARAGRRMDRLVLAVMAATALISMWVSNAATASMMLPVALGLVHTAERSDGIDGRESAAFASSLTMGVAYAATIGGLATMLGTAPNVFAAAYLRDELKSSITFGQWLIFGVPLAALFLPIAWWVITRGVVKVAPKPIADVQREVLTGDAGQRLTIVVFATAVVLWVCRPFVAELSVGSMKPFASLSDGWIGMAAAMALWTIPVVADRDREGRARRRPLLDGRSIRTLPWDVLLLFGGGFSLAAALDAHKVGDLLGAVAGSFAGAPPLLVLTVVAALVIGVGEFASNTAMTAAAVPVMAGLAAGLHMNPVVLVITTTLAASCSFAMPVGTPPNAIAYGAGRFTVGQMARAGLILDTVGVVLVVAAAWLLIPLAFSSP